VRQRATRPGQLLWFCCTHVISAAFANAPKQTRGLTRHHNQALKDIFKGAATTVIALAPEDPTYDDHQRLLAAGTKPNLAKLTVARKIAATVLATWKKEEHYTPEKT
jgi:hypothetical protein